MYRKQKHENLYDRYGGPKKEEYARLINSDYYLPPINCPAVTREYILSVKEDAVVAVKKSEVISYDFASFSKEIAFCILKEVGTDVAELPLGFNILNLPPKQWMINVAYTIKPDHRAFISKEDLMDLKQRFDHPAAYLRELKLRLQRLPSAAELNAHYAPQIKQAYKIALRERLVALSYKYRFCAVDLNNPVLI